MATDNFRLLLAALLLIFSISFLSAQDAGYFSVTENGQTRFYQRLAWSGGEYALRYEVVIEKAVEERYEAHLRDFTPSLFIVVSLSPGEYRFRVIPYDILDKPGEPSQWVTLDVRHAVKPELMGMTSGFYTSGNQEQPPGYVLEIAGNDIEPGAEVFIRSRDGTLIPSETVGFAEEGSEVLVFVEGDKAAPGEYELLVRNPGGLESSIGGLVFEESGNVTMHELESEDDLAQKSESELEQKSSKGLVFKPLAPVLVSFGAAWTPLAPLHGEYIDTEYYPFGLYTDKELAVLGAYVNVVFSLAKNLYLGPEVKAFYSFDNDNEEHSLNLGINLLLMKWMANQKIAFAFRPGVSFILLPDAWEGSFWVNVGVSFIWRALNNVLFEIGIDYANLIEENYPFGYIRPWIGMGFVF